MLRNTQSDRTPAVDEWRARRHQLGLVTRAHLSRLRGPGEPWLVEGTTYVSIRSALRALSGEEVSRLTFDGLETLVLPDRLEEVAIAHAFAMEVVGTRLDAKSGTADWAAK